MSNTPNNNWMVTGDERETVVKRALELGITGTPDKAAHNLGPITLGNDETVTAHVVHAVDPVITDGKEVVLINRKNPPGKGLPALPGGFIDPVKGGVESAVQAAAREALEEVGIELQGGTLIGQRNMNRSYDVRTATTALPQYGINRGDIFMVSTQAVRFDVDDLSKTKLIAGDDAEPGSARRVIIADLTRDRMGIADHFDMIMQSTNEGVAPVRQNRLQVQSRNRDVS